MFTSNKIAERIKDRAKKQGLTIKDLLSICGTNKNALSTMLSGGYMPRTETIAKIADVLECSVDYLLGRTENPEVNK